MSCTGSQIRDLGVDEISEGYLKIYWDIGVNKRLKRVGKTSTVVVLCSWQNRSLGRMVVGIYAHEAWRIKSLAYARICAQTMRALLEWSVDWNVANYHELSYSPRRQVNRNPARNQKEVKFPLLKFKDAQFCTLQLIFSLSTSSPKQATTRQHKVIIYPLLPSSVIWASVYMSWRPFQLPLLRIQE